MQGRMTKAESERPGKSRPFSLFIERVIAEMIQNRSNFSAGKLVVLVIMLTGSMETVRACFATVGLSQIMVARTVQRAM